MGTYKKLSFDADDHTILYLGTNNKLLSPHSGVSIGAQRAYFKLNGRKLPGKPTQKGIYINNGKKYVF